MRCRSRDVRLHLNERARPINNGRFIGPSSRLTPAGRTYDGSPVGKTPSEPARVAILGGGIAGVAAAAELTRRGSVRVEIFEKEARLGGLQHSLPIGGVEYDIGAFFFDRRHQVFELFPTVKQMFTPIALAQRVLTPTGELDSYPPTLGAYVRDQGRLELLLSALSLAGGKIRHRRRDTLASFVRYYLGERLYQRSGLRNYIERLYGIDEKDIDLEFAVQRMAFLAEVCSLRRLVPRLAGRLWRRPVARKEVLVRPRAGFAVVYDAIGRELSAHGVEVHLSCRIGSIKRRDRGFTIESSVGVQHYDRVISTIPVGATSRLVGLPVESGFEYMKLISLFYRFRGEAGHDGGVLFNFTYDGNWKRVVALSRFYGPDRGDDYFVVEVTAREADTEAVAAADRAFREHAQRHGLYRGALELVGAHVTDHAYPIYLRQHAATVRESRSRLERWGIDLIGRQGRFDYLSSEAAAASARAFAQSVAEAAGAPVSE